MENTTTQQPNNLDSITLVLFTWSSSPYAICQFPIPCNFAIVGIVYTLNGVQPSFDSRQNVIEYMHWPSRISPIGSRISFPPYVVYCYRKGRSTGKAPKLLSFRLMAARCTNSFQVITYPGKEHLSTRIAQILREKSHPKKRWSRYSQLTPQNQHFISWSIPIPISLSWVESFPMMASHKMKPCLGATPLTQVKLYQNRWLALVQKGSRALLMVKINPGVKTPFDLIFHSGVWRKTCRNH